MECAIEAALIGITGVLAGALIGHRLAIGREDRVRLAIFNSRMCKLKSAADKIEDADFEVWFAKTQILIEEECGLVQNSICYWHTGKLTDLRMKISKIQKPDLADFDNNKSSFPRAFMTYQNGRIYLTSLLQDLINCAG